ncbi:MAG: hypothetical protein E6K14_07745 [Methanobacteriota archaeon]|nr:MAG: hypothetical protein E6K14_07745 [Euryarchaeota archaeon]
MYLVDRKRRFPVTPKDEPPMTLREILHMGRGTVALIGLLSVGLLPINPEEGIVNLKCHILHVTCVKVVQTQLSETEYSLLAAYAAARKKTIKEVAREAIRQAVLRDEVDPSDPIFRAFPLTRKKGRITDGSERVDYYLYGPDR